MKQIPIPLDCFNHRYTLRHPTIEDTDALLQLEHACWPNEQCISRRELQKRLSRSSTDHLVLSVDEKIVGAIYAQPIDNIAGLNGHTYETASDLYVKNGSIIHLLAVNVLPSMQYLGFGDQLLEFMILYSSIREGVNQVIAVSRCKNDARQAAVPYERYIHQKDHQGIAVDPILRFHDQHGGRIDGIIPGYRPDDRENQGCGVLVIYNSPHRTLGQVSTAHTGEAQPVDTPEQMAECITSAVRFILKSKNLRQIKHNVPLHDLGMDSLDLFGLRLILARKLNHPVSPTFFFQHCTVEAIICYFNAVLFEMNPCPPLTQSLKPEAKRAEERPCRVAAPQLGITKSTRKKGRYTPREAVAVVGMACRLPQADNIWRFWSLLLEGRDAITGIPEDRWPAHFNNYTDDVMAGKINAPFGGFLTHVDTFDASFFNITPREANALDPQQRILLEVHHDALEYAGIAQNAIAGSNTGFFVGTFACDYERLQARSKAWEKYDLYFGTGNSAAMTAGRLAYTFGCHGPAINLNTACSSSLVSIHLACQSLGNGECDLAMASGVNLLLTPELSISFSNAGMLARDGRCKTFDAAADGYVRSEGCGVLVLKRLSDALADNNTIYALIPGSAVNQDGPSNGLTAPNAAAQAALIQSALDRSGLLPEDIDYIEAHGTGTALGDPIEFEALARIFGRCRDEKRPLLIGSVKTNIGHTEAAAGVSAMIKVILAMHHGIIPRHLHFDHPNPYIDLQQIPAAIPLQNIPWKKHRAEKPLRAGVSAFGFSGTNAHVILEEWPAAASMTSPAWEVLPLSAKSATALSQLAETYIDFLNQTALPALRDICFTAQVGRSHYKHRLAAVGRNLEEIRQNLQSATTNRQPPYIFTGSRKTATVAFGFTGQGAQYTGMGRDLYHHYPVFREALDRCAHLLADHLEVPLLSIIFPQSPQDPAAALLEQTAYTQPALFAMAYALAELWQSWGVYPEVVMGHSVGEYVAACLAGIFKLDDALRLISARGRLMQAITSDGAMSAVFTDLSTVQKNIADLGAAVDIAAVNGPANIVVSGLSPEVKRLTDELAKRSISSIPLNVSHAFHSALMEPMLDEFRSIAQEITFTSPSLRIISNLTGKLEDDRLATADYWVGHIRRPVQFAESIATLAKTGIDIFLEIGPKPILTGMAGKCFEVTPEAPPPACLSCLWPGKSDIERVHSTLGALYCLGYDIDWASYHSRQPENQAVRRVALPNYAFQRRRYWLTDREPPVGPTIEPSAGTGTRHSYHPLLGNRFSSPVAEIIFSSIVKADQIPYAINHQIGSRIVLPASAYVEMAHAAAKAVLDTDAVRLRDLLITRAMTFPENDCLRLQTILSRNETQTPTSDLKIAFYSQKMSSTRSNGDGSQAPWQCHATATVSKIPPISETTPAPVDIAAIQKACELFPSAKVFDPSDLSCIGIASFQHNSHQALGKIISPKASSSPDELSRFGFHPALLDACLQLGAKYVSLRQGSGLNGVRYILMGIGNLEIYTKPPQTFWCHVVTETNGSSKNPSGPSETVAIKLTLCDPAGRPIVRAEDILFQRHDPGALNAPFQNGVRHLYYVGYHPLPSVPHDDPAKLIESVKRQVTAPSVASDSSAPADMDQEQPLNLLESLSLDYIKKAIRHLGWAYRPGECLSFDQISSALKIDKRHHRLTRRMMEILEEEGLLQPNNGHWKVLKALPDPFKPPHNDSKVENLIKRYPELAAELTILTRCGENLDRVLNGACDPLFLLFPEADIANASQLYSHSLAFGPMNRLVGRTVGEIVKSLATTRRSRLRILELGAGTGGTTAHILPAIKGHRTEYIFTDVSSLFTRKARMRFREYPFIQYRQLDIENPPSGQGFTDGQIDIVIGANVLHATTDLKKSLGHIRRLLAPSGLLVLLEGIEPRKWIDLIFGLIEGWWRFEDKDLRTAYPLISSAKWQTLLNECGFSQPVAIAPEMGEKALFNQSILLARNTPNEAPQSRINAKRHYLLLADRGVVSKTIRTTITAQGHLVTAVFNHPLSAEKRQEFVVSPDDSNAFKQILNDHPTITHILHVWGLDVPFKADLSEENIRLANALTCQASLNLIQALHQLRPDSLPRLQVVVNGVQAPIGANPAETVQSPVNFMLAPFYALTDVIRQELPELDCRLYDLPLHPQSTDLQLLGEELTALGENNCDPPRKSLRNGQWYTPRLERAEIKNSTPIQLKPDGTYIITGGLGGLGQKITAWMASQGAGRIVIINRRSPAAKEREAFSALNATGTHITVLQGDVADPADMDAIFEKLSRAGHRIKGIVHAAGVFEDRLLVNHSWEKFERVFAPKINGSWLLHQHSRKLSLDFFILFSSAMTLLPNSGLSNYVAANAFMDALALYRRQQGLPGLSIAWGPWQDSGMALTVGHLRNSQWRSWGLNALSEQQALNALQRLIGSLQRELPPTSANHEALPAPHVGVMAMHWPTFSEYFHPYRQTETTRPGPSVPDSEMDFYTCLLDRLPQPDTPHREIPQEISLLKRIEETCPADRESVLIESLRRLTATVMGYSTPGDLDIEEGFFQQGMDSLMAVELRSRLQKELACRLPSTLIFKYPNIIALGDYLVKNPLKNLIPQKIDGMTQPASTIPLPQTNKCQMPPHSEADINVSIEAELDELEKMLDLNE